jgi:methionyl-tRNA formyltransferase
VFAYSDLGHACLKYLLDHKENVVALYTHEDNPSEKIWFPSVAECAHKAGIPVLTPQNLNSTEEMTAFKRFSPDLIFSFYYRSLIPTSVLSLARLGAFNMHGSFLPKYRGRAPVNWAVLHGEKKSGATLHVMTEKADAGDIVDQESVLIGSDDTTAVVQARVTQAAVLVLSRQLENLIEGKAPRRSQDPSEATTFGKRRPEDGLIHWEKSAREIHNLVRAVSHPYPGAFTDMGGIKTYIWSSQVLETPSLRLKPGQFDFVNGRFIAGCGAGGIEILRAQPEGEKEMDGNELARRLFSKDFGK